MALTIKLPRGMPALGVLPMSRNLAYCDIHLLADDTPTFDSLEIGMRQGEPTLALSLRKDGLYVLVADLTPGLRDLAAQWAKLFARQLTLKGRQGVEATEKTGAVYLKILAGVQALAVKH